MLQTRPFEDSPDKDFLKYWESLGFFENISLFLPPDFFILFDIARILFNDETADAYKAVEDLSLEEKIYVPERDEAIQVNRVDKSAPLGDKMELDFFKNVTELKKAPPRELAQDEDIFNIKLLTKTLLVQKFFESEADSFKPISTSRNESGKDANRFEQKFYILLDRSRSMDMKMRSFYSKCIVAELLRRKMQSKAKLFFRAFDSTTGTLFKIEKPEDFPILIEKVLLTTTGGTSTNIQGAVYQAVNDIQYDKEKTKAEILLVTDGISKIEKNELKYKLGDIKLNVLKIGEDPPEPDYFEMEGFFKAELLDVDPGSYNLREIQKKIASQGSIEGGEMTPRETRIYRAISDYSDKIFRDLKDVSNKFIEVRDLQAEGLYNVDDEKLDQLERNIKRLGSQDVSSLSHDEKKRLYKQVYLLLQYVQMLLDNGNSDNPRLNSFGESLYKIKTGLMKDPDLIYSIAKANEFSEDKETMKLAKKELKNLLKNMQLDNKDISIADMQRAEMMFNMDPGGKGNMAKFLIFLFIQLYRFIKKLVTYPFRKDKA